MSSICQTGLNICTALYVLRGQEPLNTPLHLAIVTGVHIFSLLFILISALCTFNSVRQQTMLKCNSFAQIDTQRCLSAGQTTA